MANQVKKNIGIALLSHFVRYLAPLAAYPILTRELGTEGFAKFSMMLAISMVLSQIIEFGYGLSGVREISQGARESGKISGTIIFSRAVIALLVSIVAIVLIGFIDIFGLDGYFDLAAVLFCAAAYGFSASWYFIGVEKVKDLAKLELACALSSLVLVVVLVKSHDDVLLALYAFSVPLWGAVVVGTYRAVKHLGFEIPGLSEFFTSLRISARFFVLVGVSPIVSRLSLISLGMFSSSDQVAFYAAAERIVTAAVNSLQPIVRILLPRISALIVNDKAAARQLLMKSTLFVSFVYFAAASIGIYFAAVWVPWFFGKQLSGATEIAQVQLALLPVVALGRCLGMLGLVPMHAEAPYKNMTLIVGLMSLLATPLASIYGGAVSVSYVRVLSELLLSLLCGIYLMKLQRSFSGRLG